MPSITVLNINTFLNSNQILFLDKVLYVHNINIVVMQIAQKMKNTSERAIFVGGDECMVLKMILIAFLVIAFLWQRWISYLTWKQRSKPLPEAVSTIYTPSRYAKFLSYKKEYAKLSGWVRLGTLAISIFYILSPFFTWFDGANPYLSAFLTYMVMELIEEGIDIPVVYYETFQIDEKYGLNKQTKSSWIKDHVLDFVFETFVMLVVGGLLIYLCTHLSTWTNGFSISYRQSFLFCLIILAIYLFLMIAMSFLSLLVMRKKYTFTEMEEGPLRSQIEAYASEAKKKVRHIKIYDESKKSNDKNAFLLKFLWIREFGIADNFIQENSEDELLAVLLHEIGHLKHKKNIWNYLHYAFLVLLFFFFVWLIPHAQTIVDLNTWINQSFGLSHTNYVLSFMVFSYGFAPISFVLGIYHNFVSCKEEKEADKNAVDHGYGQALIDTFTQLSSDELIDVNPHPIVERLYYDHPGMYQRISYIQAWENAHAS